MSELANGELIWDGPKDHFAEARLVHHVARGDSVHLFYRERANQNFTYQGSMRLVQFKLNEDGPSRFTFRLEGSNL